MGLGKRVEFPSPKTHPPSGIAAISERLPETGTARVNVLFAKMAFNHFYGVVLRWHCLRSYHYARQQNACPHVTDMSWQNAG